MIKFFRKIRQKLVTENKFSKYLLYAIGEIALVVIGILIALSINNWNQRQINKNKELALIRSLNKELILNQDYLVSRIDFLTQVVEEKGKRLLKLTGPSAKSIEIDSLSKLLLKVIYQEPYAPIISKYQHIMSSDDNNLIKSDTLKQLLFEYQASLDLASWNQFEMRKEILQYLHINYSTLNMLTKQKIRVFNNLKNEDYADNYFPADPNFILSDKKFQNIIVTRLEANAFTISILNGLLKHIKKMKNYIQNHYEI